MNKTCEKCIHYDVCRYPLEYRAYPDTCWKYEEERPRGKWVPGREISQMWTGDKLIGIDYEDFSCSCCGVVVEESTEPEWNYCPHCGADMREGDSDA